MKFFVEATFGAFSGAPPEAAWSVFSAHTTASAAVKRMLAELAEMRRVVGPNAWSRHFRVTRSDGVDIQVRDIINTLEVARMQSEMPRRRGRLVSKPPEWVLKARAWEKALLKTGVYPTT